MRSVVLAPMSLRCIGPAVQVLAWGVVGTVGACGPAHRLPESIAVSGEPPPISSTSVDTAPPEIVSAHLSRVDDPTLGGRDSLLVVFNVEIDAASLVPNAFIISYASGGSVAPERSVLAPASEDDENRSILLIGDFWEQDRSAPALSYVTVGAKLYTEEGEGLLGLRAAVSPYDEPLRMVAIERRGVDPGRCPEATGVLRSYWSDELRGVDSSDLARVRVQTQLGQSIVPTSFDDHDTHFAEVGQDNVLDFCLAESRVLQWIRIDAGAFFDAAGHQNGAIELRISDLGE